MKILEILADIIYKIIVRPCEYIYDFRKYLIIFYRNHIVSFIVFIFTLVLSIAIPFIIEEYTTNPYYVAVVNLSYSVCAGYIFYFICDVLPSLKKTRGDYYRLSQNFERLSDSAYFIIKEISGIDVIQYKEYELFQNAFIENFLYDFSKTDLINLLFFNSELERVESIFDELFSHFYNYFGKLELLELKDDLVILKILRKVNLQDRGVYFPDNKMKKDIARLLYYLYWRSKKLHQSFYLDRFY